SEREGKHGVVMSQGNAVGIGNGPLQRRVGRTYGDWPVIETEVGEHQGKVGAPAHKGAGIEYGKAVRATEIQQALSVLEGCVPIEIISHQSVATVKGANLLIFGIDA